MNRVEVYLVEKNEFIKQIGRKRYIWDSNNCYLVVVTYIPSPNTNPQYSLYLWKGGNNDIECE